MKNISRYLNVVAFVTLMAGCAATTTTTIKETKNDAEIKPAAYNGPKTRLQVVQFDLPQKTLAAYPELAEKRVGWGLNNQLVDAFYDAGRFEFVEEKDEIINRMMKTWALSQSGVVSDSTAIKEGGLKAPRYLVYAEVFDFSVSTGEMVVGLAARQDKITRIGIQIRLVDVASGQYIPSSGIGEVTVEKNAVIFSADQKGFDQSTVGKASKLAINTAVNQLLRRLPQ
jgi:curli biogenesis system outer membrane secretion channel CsgG